MSEDELPLRTVLQLDFGVELRRLRKSAGQSQLDVAEEVARSHSYISKLETGAMAPDSSDLAMITNHFRPDSKAEERLTAAYRRATSKRRIEPHEIDEAETIISTANRIRLSGLPKTGWELATRSAFRFYRAALETRLDSGAEEQVQHLLGHLLYEAIKCKLDFDLSGAASDPRLAWVAQLQMDLASRSTSSDDRTRASLAEEAYRYALGDHDAARRATDELAGNGMPAATDLRTELGRAVAINCFDGEEDWTYKLAINTAEESVDGDSVDDASFILEGLARIPVSDAQLRHRAFVRLRQHLAEHEFILSPTRRSQAARTLLRIEDPSTKDMELLLLAERAAEAARLNGLDRYVAELNQLTKREN